MWKKLKVENQVHKMLGVLEKQPYLTVQCSLRKIDRLFFYPLSKLRPVYQPCVFWILSHPTMISCLSLGPMVTREIWHAGSLRNHWPHEEGCQVGIYSTTNISLLALWKGFALIHELLLTQRQSSGSK